MRSWLAIAACVALLAAPAKAAEKADPFAQLHNLKLGYAIYLGGLHLMDSTTDFTRNGPVYHIAMKAGTQGIVRTLVPWDADLTSTGTLVDDTIRPTKGTIVTRWKKEPATVEFNYSNGKDVRPRFEPAVDMNKNEEVPDALRHDSLDPLNGIVQMMTSFAYGKGCAQTVPIFDGHRRFDVQLKDRGTATLKSDGYSIYDGPAQKCEVQLTMRAGTRKDREGSKFWEDGKNAGQRPPIYIYLAKMRPHLPPVPVRAETDTFFGGVMIHLTELGGPSAVLANKE